MTSAQLTAWLDREEGRRRATRRGPFRLSPWIQSLLIAVGAGAGCYGLLRTGRGMQALHWWVTATALAHVTGVFLAPFRLYWRRDLAVLTCLPIAGEVLFSLALRRSIRASAQLSVPLAAAACTFVVLDEQLAVYCAALLAVAFVTSGLLAPALALVAGALVTSDKAQSLIGSMGGEFRAPKTSWLGILPGIAGAGLVLLLIAAVPTVEGARPWRDGAVVPLMLGAVVFTFALLAHAVRSAPRVAQVATQEVAALDRQRFAHVDLVKPSPLEELAAVALPTTARLVYRKDVSMLHRRYPIPYVVGFLCLATAWIVGFAAPQAALSWGGAALAAAALHGVVVRRRLSGPPIEYERLIRSLPLPERDVRRAKRRVQILWTFWYVGVGSVPMMVRSADAPIIAALTGGLVVAALVAGELT